MIVRIFICVRTMAAEFYSQIKISTSFHFLTTFYYFTTKHSLLLLLLHLNGASERNVIPGTKRYWAVDLHGPV